MSKHTSRPCGHLIGASLIASFILFLGAASTSYAAPIHPTLAPPFDAGVTFNHACGVASDTQGNLYVASSGEGSIEVFDPAREHLTTIANPNEPCGLAVNSKGDLFVSEAGSGEVVRYRPDAFPLTATPSYGPREVIDASGNAKGIAVDRFDDLLYVAQGSRVAMFNAEGTAGINEVQRIFTHNATGGTYRLIFKGQETAPIAHNAPPIDIQAALEALSTIGTGNVSVAVGPFPTNRDVTFRGALGGSDVEQLQANTAGLTGTISISTIVNGFDGHLLEGEVSNATGVAPYTYKVSGTTTDRYLFVAEDGESSDAVRIFGGSDVRALGLRETITGVDHDEDPATAEQKLGFGEEGAYLAADPGNRSGDDKCAQVGDPPQACTAGHFFVYDDAHKTLEEFEASGEHLGRTDLVAAEPGFSDAKPTAIAIERSGGPGDGRIYVTSGAGAGAQVLAFGPLPAPSRGPRPQDSFVRGGISDVAVDRFGTRYVAAGSTIFAYEASGTGKIAVKGPNGEDGLASQGNIGGIAVDGQCNVYAIEEHEPFDAQDSTVNYFTPQDCPPKAGTTYSGSASIVAPGFYRAIAVNPANDHVFLSRGGTILELESKQGGSGVVDPNFGSGLGLSDLRDLAVHGASGNVYVSGGPGGNTVWVVDPGGEGVVDDEAVLARVTGAGSPSGPFSGIQAIAVDQANGHFVAFMGTKGIAEEFEASGAFVAQFPETADGTSTEAVGVAIDNSGGPTDGRAYLAINVGAANLRAFDPLAYGEVPRAASGTASEIGAGSATLNGTVDPRGFEVSECHFEYLSEADYESNGESFAGATTVPCAQSGEEIGKGLGPVAVHAEISGITPEATRYRFRLVAANKYGEEAGKAGIFGPPVARTLEAEPVFYDEATLRGEVDPSGLETTYRFEYVSEAQFAANGFEGAASRPATTLAPGDGAVAIAANLFGLAEGTGYRFRLVAENDAAAVEGSVKTFETLQRVEVGPCPNDEFRIGASARLPDCRAYELVTPADTRGMEPLAAFPGTAGAGFNNWLVTPRGPGAGNSVAYFVVGTLPGYEGNALLDGYRAARGAGDHPAEGWSSELFAPSLRQTGNIGISPGGVGADQLYSFWPVTFPTSADFEGMLPRGNYLRTAGEAAGSACNPEPAQGSFELIGCGSQDADPKAKTDPNAQGEFIAPGGQLIFSSEVALEDDSPAAGTSAIYRRAAGSEQAEVVSLLPNGAAPSQGAVYVAATEDGAAVAFKLGGDLYVRRAGEASVKVADGPNSFAGFSADKERVFYADAAVGGGGPLTPAGLFAFEIDTASAAPIASESAFVNVSDDGSTAYFTSKAVLDGAGEGTPGAHNLYRWDGSQIGFVAILDARDFTEFGRDVRFFLHRWTDALSAGQLEGRAFSPTRSSPGGEVLLFQSHAQLTAYDNTEASAGACESAEVAGERCAEIYRYEAGAGELQCVSCDPTGARPTAEPELQSDPPTETDTLVPNVTDDGRRVFFQSEDSLLPEDANTAIDVYQWSEQGVDCKRTGGCLALISTGQGDSDSELYGMSADGRDVFFRSSEQLHSQDIPGTSSLYDARAGGGIPRPAAKTICEGDACQGDGNAPPVLPALPNPATGDGPVTEGRKCPKGKRRVKGRCARKRCGKAKRRVKGRCVKKAARKGRHNRNSNRGRSTR